MRDLLYEFRHFYLVSVVTYVFCFFFAKTTTNKSHHTLCEGYQHTCERHNFKRVLEIQHRNIENTDGASGFLLWAPIKLDFVSAVESHTSRRVILGSMVYVNEHETD